MVTGYAQKFSDNKNRYVKIQGKIQKLAKYFRQRNNNYTMVQIYFALGKYVLEQKKSIKSDFNKKIVRYI